MANWSNCCGTRSASAASTPMPTTISPAVQRARCSSLSSADTSPVGRGAVSAKAEHRITGFSSSILLIGPCPVFYPVCLFSCGFDVQFSRQYLGGLKVFGFPFFAIFASQSSSILFTWSLHARLLILMTSWIPQMLRISSLRILSRESVTDAF